MTNAYKLRFACGSAGYEEILRQKFPFPCIRILTRKLENLKFTSGTVITEIFEFLKIKIAHFEKDIYEDCMIVLDEMSITSGKDHAHKHWKSGHWSNFSKLWDFLACDPPIKSPYGPEPPGSDGKELWGMEVDGI